MGPVDPRWIKMAELCGQGATLKEIGLELGGLSRERVRQLLLERPDLEDIRLSTRAELLEMRLASPTPRKPVRIFQIRTCKMCGGEIAGKRTVYCSDKCYKAFTLTRYQTDPVYRERHKEATKRYYDSLDKDDQYRRHVAKYRSQHPLPTLKCQTCRAEFTQRSPKQRFCSKACALGGVVNHDS